MQSVFLKNTLQRYEFLRIRDMCFALDMSQVTRYVALRQQEFISYRV